VFGRRAGYRSVTYSEGRSEDWWTGFAMRPLGLTKRSRIEHQFPNSVKAEALE